MQVLFTAARQKVLQVKQEQGQEAGPGPGCKFVAQSEQEMQVFVPVIPLTHSHPSNSMLTTTGMQTRGPLLI